MKALVLAGALALGISSAASAAIVVTTYEGTVTVGEDAAGLLGTAGADLAGLTYVAVLTLDTSINRHTPGPDGESDVVYGPETEGTTSNPFLSAVVTLDGTEIMLPLHGLNFAYVAEAIAITHSSSIFAPNYWDFFAEGVGIPGNLDTAFGIAPGDNSYGEFSLADGAGGYALFARGGVSRVRSTVAGVPEPATWALMILGFGAAGATLRRARRLDFC